MTRYVAAYDTESAECLAACHRIVEVHHEHQMPATFFVVGRTLEANPREYRELLDDPLFEVCSHTYSHQLLRDHPLCGSAPSDSTIRDEVVRGVDAIEQVFQRKVRGFRPAVGFSDGLRGASVALDALAESEVDYVSSLLWGPDDSMPALLRRPFRYADEGHFDLCELPGHGWHENLLKNHQDWGPRRITLWPSPFPEAMPRGFLDTPEEETAVNRIFLEKAGSESMPYVSFIWHPWSLDRFDPEMRMLEQTFRLVSALGLVGSRFADVCDDFLGKPL